MKEANNKRRKSFFILHPCAYASEPTGFLADQKTTALTFKIKNKPFPIPYSLYPSDSGKRENATFIPVKKIGKGKFGNPQIPNLIDYANYTLHALLELPLILKHDAVVFVCPPFFDCLTIPILKLFKKEIYTIQMDAQYEVALNFNKKMNLLRKAYYSFAGALENYSIKNSTKVFPVSKFLEEKYKKLNKNVFLIPNGADVEYIAKIKPERKFKEYTITCLSGIEHYRGVDLLIDAFKEFKKTGRKAKLILIGDGPDAHIAKQKARNDSDITFTGYLPYEKALALCKGSDILVMPSRNTLASKTICSAKSFAYIACEVPSVTTNTGDHAYWTEKTKTGLIVEDTPESISQGLAELYDDKNLYKRLKDNCVKNKNQIDYRTLKSKFTEEVMK